MTINNLRPVGDIEQAEHENSLDAKRVFDVVANSLVPSDYDYISLSYTGENLTGVVYKKGGSGGTTISTLTLAYTGDKLISK